MLMRSLAFATVTVLFIGTADARPAGCPHAWCGCYMALKKGFSGATARALWVARNWAKMFPRAALAPGNVAVFARGRGGHVGEIVDVRPGQILLHSGNDGRAVRTRWRSTRGLLAVVNPHASYASHSTVKVRSKPVRTAKRKTRHRVVQRGVPAPAVVYYAHAAS